MILYNTEQDTMQHRLQNNNMEDVYIYRRIQVKTSYCIISFDKAPV